MAKDENYGWIMWAAVAAGVYLVVKNLGTGAGDLFGSGPGNDAYTAQQALPTGANAFSPSFQPFIDFYNNNGPQDQNGNIIPLCTAMNAPNLYLVNSAGTSIWGALDTVALINTAEQLKSSTSMWVVATTQSDVIAALNNLQTQLQFSFIANYYNCVYNTDLLSSLKGSLFQTGLTDANLAALISRVNNLPIS